MTDQLTDPAANAILNRIRAFGYRVDVFHPDPINGTRRRRGGTGRRSLEVHAADARTGEHHVVVVPADQAGGELACACELAELVASELEG